MKAVLPTISLRKCLTSYYEYAGQRYPISGSSSEIFKSAVRQLAPKNWEDVNLLAQDDIDIATRFYLLNRLAEIGKPMKLYPSSLSSIHH